MSHGRIAGVRTGEPLKNGRESGLRDTDAIVSNLDMNPTLVACLADNLNVSLGFVRIRILDRVL